jgi:hypothetical protein
MIDFMKLGFAWVSYASLGILNIGIAIFDCGSSPCNRFYLIQREREKERKRERVKEKKRKRKKDLKSIKRSYPLTISFSCIQQTDLKGPKLHTQIRST